MLIEKHINKKEKNLIGCMDTSFYSESGLNQAFQLNLVVMSLYLSRMIGIIPMLPQNANSGLLSNS